MKRTFCIITLAMLLCTGCATMDTPFLSDLADAAANVRLYNGRNVGETTATTRIGTVQGDLHIHLGGDNMQEHEGGASVTATATPE